MADTMTEFARATGNVAAVTAAKNALKEQAYPPGNADDVVASFFNAAAFPHFAGAKNLVFLPVPSTTGKNILPELLAEKLQQTFGGEVVRAWARPLEQRPTYSKGILAKLESPPRYEVHSSVVDRIDRGARLVLVDDVVTTGGSVQALREGLAANGLRVSHVASLAQSEMRKVSERDIERISTYFRESDVRAAVRTVLTGRLKHFANRIEQTLPHGSDQHKARVAGYFLQEATRLHALGQTQAGALLQEQNSAQMRVTQAQFQRPLLAYSSQAAIKQLETMRRDFGRATPEAQSAILDNVKQVINALPGSDASKTQAAFLAGQFVRGNATLQNLALAIDRANEKRRPAAQREVTSEISPSVHTAMAELDAIRARYTKAQGHEGSALVTEARDTIADLPGPDLKRVPLQVIAQDYVRGVVGREQLERAASDLGQAAQRATTRGRDRSRGGRG